VHLFLNNNKALDFLPINSIKNGGITALKDLGLPETAPAQVARIICDSPYYNPREYDYAELEALLTKAYWGQAPI
ncbi:hypothetical protein VXQ08_07005, partial [Acinetobacter towneri]